jgi:DnaK suppressor protein
MNAASLAVNKPRSTVLPAKADMPHAYGLRALRQGLLRRREQLLEEVRSHVDIVRGAGAPAPGGEAVTQTQMQEVTLAEAERDVAELGAVEAALARIERGEYGMCESCGEPIPIERLTANPHSLRCFACETTHERRLGAAR